MRPAQFRKEDAMYWLLVMLWGLGFLILWKIPLLRNATAPGDIRPPRLRHRPRQKRGKNHREIARFPFVTDVPSGGNHCRGRPFNGCNRENRACSWCPLTSIGSSALRVARKTVGLLAGRRGGNRGHPACFWMRTLSWNPMEFPESWKSKIGWAGLLSIQPYHQHGKIL